MNTKYILVLTLGFLYGGITESKIYKYVDEQGIIHYSDTKPFIDAKEQKIKKLTVVESNKRISRKSWKETKNKKKKNSFDNFIIASPKQDEVIWGTGGNVTVSVSFDGKMMATKRIKFYIDNIAHGKVKSKSQLIADVFRGQHTVHADLIDTQSRKVIKTTPTVTFHVKQHSKK